MGCNYKPPITVINLPSSYQASRLWFLFSVPSSEHAWQCDTFSRVTTFCVTPKHYFLYMVLMVSPQPTTGNDIKYELLRDGNTIPKIKTLSDILKIDYRDNILIKMNHDIWPYMSTLMHFTQPNISVIKYLQKFEPCSHHLSSNMKSDTSEMTFCTILCSTMKWKVTKAWGQHYTQVPTLINKNHVVISQCSCIISSTLSPKLKYQ